MKIQNDSADPLRSVPAETLAAKLSRQGQTAGTSAEPREQATDTAETSAIARGLQPDAGRLERLRESVLNGTYRVPARELSARIVDEHLDDLSTRS